jgi:hypothetical protein
MDATAGSKRMGLRMRWPPGVAASRKSASAGVVGAELGRSARGYGTCLAEGRGPLRALWHGEREGGRNRVPRTRRTR